MQALLIAVQFLTRLPIHLRAMPSPEALGRSLLWYPAVGLLIGLALLGMHGVLHGATPAIQAAVLLTGWVVLTGGLHLDGLADSADAWAGGLGDRERTLHIMKDPRSGPIAIVVVVLVLLLKFAALQTGSLTALLLSPWLARTVVPLLFLTTPYVRAGGLGAALAHHLPRRALPVWLGTYVLLMGFGMGWPAVIGLVTALGVFASVRHWMCVRLGGTTGDTAGALVELTETSVLLVLTILSPTGGLIG